jgi:hypothetical protein
VDLRRTVAPDPELRVQSTLGEREVESVELPSESRSGSRSLIVNEDEDLDRVLVEGSEVPKSRSPG